MAKVFVVGIGPGNYENMTVRADRALAECDVIVGYPVYVDLVKNRYPGKELVSTPMTQEARRCQMALELAKSGKTVALVCSGDSGVYGMAALVYALRGENTEPEIEAVPGLTAACSGGAVLGAPLTHDFAVISLSDRLTPWETIEKRLRCAAEGDFAIAIYSVRHFAARPAGGAALRHCPQHRPRGAEQPHSDARRTASGGCRYVLHRVCWKFVHKGRKRRAHHAERIPECIKFACLAARPRAANWWNF